MKLFEFIRLYGNQLSAISAVLAFLFGVYKYLEERRESHYWKEFEVFHKLVKELVEPSGENRTLYIDRQAAIIFELRNFKRYYPYSLRMLIGLHSRWSAVPDRFSRLLEELNLTIQFLESQGQRPPSAAIPTIQDSQKGLGSD
ncbi:MAG: hypothetical protein FWG26_09440 [Betaproteobacteria bacterium]|nr:hypothetical protein [Betaproteobacteria bacterium]